MTLKSAVIYYFILVLRADASKQNSRSSSKMCLQMAMGS